MATSIQAELRRGGSNALPASRAIALAVSVLFCFQLSRFYLVIQLDRFVCFDLSHNHEPGVPAAPHDHPDGEEAVPHSHDEGDHFQHCKDAFDGIGLTPVQPLGVPVAVSTQRPETAWVASLPVNPRPVETNLSPPFPPPRYLA